jgi:AbrB family looped-hinge helix DNA binding protein
MGLLQSWLSGKSKHSKNKSKMKITSKGQVTIPQDLRERFGLLPNTEVEFVPTADGRELRLLKSAKSSGRGRALVERLRGRGNPRNGHGMRASAESAARD